jgi:CHAT domain-containing protein
MRLRYHARYGRSDIKEYKSVKAFLFLEDDKANEADPVEASELADLLLTHQVPITILNACQSGKQVGAAETSLGSRLMQAGVQMVLAMGYSVTVSAAELMMSILYEQLFAGRQLSEAIRRRRKRCCGRATVRTVSFNATTHSKTNTIPQ